MAHSFLIPDNASAQKRNNFDALRLAMALLVVWSHSFALWNGSEADEPLSRLTLGAYNSGNVAVLAFFTISGFLITLSRQRSSSAIDFLRRRIARIYPGYLVAILLCSLVIVPAFSSRRFGDLSETELTGLLSNLVLHNYIIPSDAFGGKPVNGSLWSIPYEFWCYLGVMGLGLANLLGRRWIYPTIAIIVMLVRVWLDLTGRRPGGGWFGTVIGFAYFWFNVLPPFVLGGAVLIWRDTIPRSGWIFATLLGLTIGLAYLPLPGPLPAILSRFVLPVALAYSIFYVAFSSRLQMQGAARFGDFSYGAYLYAFPIQQMLATVLKERASFTVFLLASLFASIMAGALSWHLVERWFLRAVRPSSRRLQVEDSFVAP